MMLNRMAALMGCYAHRRYGGLRINIGRKVDRFGPGIIMICQASSYRLYPDVTDPSRHEDSLGSFGSGQARGTTDCFIA